MKLQKLKEKMSLTNKYIFWSIIALVVILLTTINNYYFYVYMQQLSKKDSSKLQTQLEMIVIQCKNNEIKNKQCESHIIAAVQNWSEKTIYNKSLQLETLDGNINEIRKPMQYTKATGTDILINSELLLSSNPEGYKSISSFGKITETVYKSITFSISDVYDSLYKEVSAKSNGRIIEISKKYIIVQYNDNEIKNLRYYPQDNIHVKENDIIKENDLLISGNIHSALDTIRYLSIPRSRPFLAYLLIIFLLFSITRKREEAYKESILHIQKEKKKIEEEFEETIRKINAEDAERLTKGSRIDEEEDQICSAFTKFDNILNPPVNTINIKELLDTNVNFAGTAFRQVLEKIIFTIHDKKIAIPNSKRTLASAIFDLEKKGDINRSLSQKLHSVRIYGNDNTHYASTCSTKIEALVAAMNLLTIMEEIEVMYLATKS